MSSPKEAEPVVATQSGDEKPKEVVNGVASDSAEKVEEKKHGDPLTEKSAPVAAAGAAEEDVEAEVTTGDWNLPKVEMKLVENVSGEENEEVFWSQRSKLYRWAKASTEWKERGVGEAKLMRHKETGKIRFLLRQEKTEKVVANHYVVRNGEYCVLKPNVGNDLIWVWTVMDFSDEGGNVEQLGLRFGKAEGAALFKEKFDEAAAINAPLFETVAKEESTEKTA